MRNFGLIGVLGLIGGAAMGLAGCSQAHRPTALSDSAFAPLPADDVAQSRTQSSPAHYAAVSPPPPTTQPASADPPANAPSAARSDEAMTAAYMMVAPAAHSAPSPNANSAPRDSMYMTLGGVIAEVNGTPIYANTVLSLLNAEFAAKAREMDPDTFREFARGELMRQRQASIEDEAEFAVAQLQLSDDDKKMAQAIAVEDRQKLITDYGGSIEQARLHIEADGQNFDDFLQQQYRAIMQHVYYEKKIFPRIQVSAADMRKFYDANRDRLYSTPASANFRVIKIDPQRIGGANADAVARQRIESIRQQALRGADFATLASSENQDEFLKDRAGDPGCPMQRNSYRVDAVDKAVWQLQPGQLTPIIESDDAFWLAKLESRTQGRTRPFDDQSVQDDVHNRLWQQQFEGMREAVLDQMDANSSVRRDDNMLQAALDMAMQEYDRWHAVRQ